MLFLTLLTSLVSCFTVTSFATTIHVPDDQLTIQAGLNTAIEGDTVLVAAGTYYENIIWPAVNGIKLIGSGQEDCIIDGDLLASVIRFEGDLGGIIDTNTLVTGLTLQNGCANDDLPPDSPRCGGGIYCNYASPSLVDLTVTGNSAASYGGGIYCYSDSNPYIAGLIITDNLAENGGGICCRQSSPLILDVTIRENEATSGGGLFCTFLASPTVTDVMVMTNTAIYSGGGVYVSTQSNPVFLNATITGNSAASGGGVFCHYSSPSLENVTIEDNSAASDGGGIYGEDASDLVLLNVVISGNTAVNGSGIYCRAYSNPNLNFVTINDNSASAYGGGIYCLAVSCPSLAHVMILNNSAYFGGGIYCRSVSSPDLNHVTLCGNSADNGGGIFCEDESSPNLVNCILRNSEPQEVFFPSYGPQNSITISCSDIQGGEAGIEANDNGEVYWLENNIDVVPLFCDPDNGDYRLQLDSPCRTDVCGFMGCTGETCDGEGVEELIATPPQFGLVSAYPNPFNPLTMIEYSLSAPSDVTLSVYNISGQLIDVIHDGYMAAGRHSATWMPSDLSSGIYFVELKASSFRDVMKVSYIK